MKLSFAVRGQRKRDILMIRSVITAGGMRKTIAMKAQLSERAVDDDRGACDKKPTETDHKRVMKDEIESRKTYRS